VVWWVGVYAGWVGPASGRICCASAGADGVFFFWSGIRVSGLGWVGWAGCDGGEEIAVLEVLAQAFGFRRDEVLPWCGDVLVCCCCAAALHLEEVEKRRN
jgi:hypothetical protein